MPLTDAKLRTLKPAEKPLKLSDSGGLQIVVMPNGSRLWRLAYRFGGKQKQLALGAYPLVSLAEARDARDARANCSSPAPTQLRRERPKSDVPVSRLVIPSQPSPTSGSRTRKAGGSPATPRACAAAWMPT